MNATHIEAKNVQALDGWKWIADGFAMFKSNPGMWLVLFLVYLIIGILLSFVPMLGPLVLNIIAPVFLVGFMSGCRDIDRGEDLEINHLFYGFKNSASQLVTVGGIYCTGLVLVAGIMFASLDHETFQSIYSGKPLTEEQALAIIESGTLVYMLFGTLLLVPLMMAYWFAPMLVAFHGMKPVDAFKMSFKACMLNIKPFFVYSIAAMVLMMIAVIPLGLGMLVMIPTMMASLYTSYKDIFVSVENVA